MVDPILSYVRKALEEIGVEPTRVVPGARLVDDLDLDSLDWADLVSRIEDAVAVSLREEKLSSVRTVEELAERLRRELPSEPERPG